jgi:imidazolonepropionase-like amidohydrolase
MPGLIVCHWHTMFANVSQMDLMVSDALYMAIAGAAGAKETLMRGFTTVRDVGGNSFGVKRATDNGLIEGPIIYSSGAFISQTSGNFDFRGPNDVPANAADPLPYFGRVGMTMVADGVPQVLQRVREQLRAGASQIKLATGGGVSSSYDPIDVAEYTFEASLELWRRELWPT